MKEYVYFCKNCRRLEADTADNRPFRCEECGGKFQPLHITVPKWKAATPEERRDIVNRSVRKETSRNNINRKQDSNVNVIADSNEDALDKIKAFIEKISVGEEGKNSKLAIVGFVLSFFSFLSIFGLVAGIIDLLKKDGRKKGLSIATVCISVIMLLASIGIASGNSDESEKNNFVAETVAEDVNQDISLDDNMVVDSTEVPEVVEDVEANSIESVFLALTPETTEEQFISLIEQSGLVWHSKEYSGSKSIHYRAAYEESTATFWRADSQECIEASFSKGDRELEDGTFAYAELNMSGLTSTDGFIYHHGVYWTIQNSLDAGYYTVSDVNDRSTYILYNSAEEVVSALYNGANIINSNSYQVPDVAIDNADLSESVKAYATDAVRIRQQPNTDCEVLGKAQPGDEVVILGEEGEWSHIKYKDLEGYIKSELLSQNTSTTETAQEETNNVATAEQAQVPSSPLQEKTAAVASTPEIPVATSGGGNEDNFHLYDNAEQQQTSDTWVLNTSKMKIHKPKCSSVAQISPENYATSNSSVAELQAQGYSPCGRCNPR